MVTLFSMPKAFKGHFGVIQRNAISQWTRLRPRPEILLFGNEDGTAEIAREFALRHIQEVKGNEYGTPLLSDLFERAHALATNNTLCYVNADILLLGDFIGAVQQVVSWRDRFLIVGRRTNVDLDEPAIYASPEQEARLRAFVARQGRLAGPAWIDYFVFPQELFSTIPAFAVGRPGWDNWMLWKARALRAALIDASDVVLAVHQNHDYSHHPQGWKGVHEGEEAEQNRKLAEGHFCAIDDSTHKLRGDGIEYNFRQLPTAWWRAFCNITAPIRHPLGLRQEKVASVLGRIKRLAS